MKKFKKKIDAEKLTEVTKEIGKLKEILAQEYQFKNKHLEETYQQMSKKIKQIENRSNLPMHGKSGVIIYRPLASASAQSCKTVICLHAWQSGRYCSGRWLVLCG